MTTALARSIRAPWTGGGFPCCASTGSGRTTNTSSKHMQETFRALIAEMGGEVFSPMPTAERGYGIAAGGTIIHELGGMRVGDDPKTAVLNRWCQAHDCKNLFVADGGPFVSQADKNPTWTILALSLRTSEYIA